MHYTGSIVVSTDLAVSNNEHEIPYMVAFHPIGKVAYPHDVTKIEILNTPWLNPEEKQEIRRLIWDDLYANHIIEDYKE